jgi:hypothetical protein
MHWDAALDATSFAQWTLTPSACIPTSFDITQAETVTKYPANCKDALMQHNLAAHHRTLSPDCSHNRSDP